jgi:hypothetical protein
MNSKDVRREEAARVHETELLITMKTAGLHVHLTGGFRYDENSDCV